MSKTSRVALFAAPSFWSLAFWSLAFSSLAFLLWQPAWGQGRTGKLEEARQLEAKAAEKLAEGKVRDAERLYRRAIDRGQLETAYERFSMLMFAQKRYAEGLKAVQEGLRQHVGSSSLRAQRGAHLFKLKRAKEAYADLNAVAPQRRDDFAVQAVTAQCCIRVRDYVCTEGAVDAYLKHRPSVLARRDYSFRVLRALALLRRGELPVAAEEIRRVLSARPRYLAGLAARAEYLVARRAYRAAAERYALLAKRLPVSEIGLYHGRALLGVNEPAKALEQAKAYLVAHPKDERGQVLRADALTALGRREQALDGLQKVSPSPAIRRKRARLMIALRRFDAAVTETGELLKSTPTDENSIQLGLRALLGKKDADAAEQLARRAEKNELKIRTLGWVARAYSVAGKRSDALRVLQLAYSRAKDDYRVRTDLVFELIAEAAALDQQGKRKDALKTLAEAQAVMPESVIVNRNLAVLQLAAGTPKEAMGPLKTLLERVGSDFTVNRIAARVYQASGDIAKAEQRIKIAVEQVAKGENYALQLGVALGEWGQLTIEAGRPSEGIKQLRRALATLKGKTALAKGSPIGQWLYRTLALGYLRRAVKATSGPRAAARDVRRALALANQLLQPARGELLAVAALASIVAGDARSGLRLLRRARRTLPKVVKRPYAKVADRLLRAYVGYRSAAPRARTRGIRQLIAAAQQVKGAHRRVVLDLVVNGSLRLANTHFRRKNLRGAKAAHAQGLRYLRRAPGPNERHNGAVINYRGNRQQSLATLVGLKGRVPLASCNLAVYHTQAGNADKAHALFKACLRQRAPYPGLPRLVAAQERVRKAFQ